MLYHLDQLHIHLVILLLACIQTDNVLIIHQPAQTPTGYKILSSSCHYQYHITTTSPLLSIQQRHTAIFFTTGVNAVLSMGHLTVRWI